eukprot:10417417-Lingulodinium_polyedra.AAC.1
MSWSVFRSVLKYFCRWNVIGFDPVEPGERRLEFSSVGEIRSRAVNFGHVCYLSVKRLGVGLRRPNSREERPPSFCYE